MESDKLTAFDYFPQFLAPSSFPLPEVEMLPVPGDSSGFLGVNPVVYQFFPLRAYGAVFSNLQGHFALSHLFSSFWSCCWCLLSHFLVFVICLFKNKQLDPFQGRIECKYVYSNHHFNLKWWLSIYNLDFIQYQILYATIFLTISFFFSGNDKILHWDIITLLPILPSHWTKLLTCSKESSFLDPPPYWGTYSPLPDQQRITGIYGVCIKYPTTLKTAGPLKAGWHACSMEKRQTQKTLLFRIRRTNFESWVFSKLRIIQFISQDCCEVSKDNTGQVCSRGRFQT